MNLDKLNNLIELFSHQAEKQNKESIFLQWLNPNNKKSYTWGETQKNILINSFFLAITIGMIIASGGIGKNELSINDTRPK